MKLNCNFSPSNLCTTLMMLMMRMAVEVVDVVMASLAWLLLNALLW